MALHLIGLGLHDVRDICVKGLDRVRACDRVVAEFYTARLMGSSQADLEAFFGRPVEVLDRLGVERGGAALVDDASRREVAFLTAGDPLAATTHVDLIVRARAAGVPVRIVHGASITSAAPGLLGLQHYKFGRTTTLVRPEKGWSPTSPFDAVAENRARGLHTLVLLDIKSDEGPRGADGHPTGYFMTANEGLEQLLDLARRTGNDWFSAQSQAGVVARAGSDAGRVATGTIARLVGEDFGPPLHCIVLPGDLHVVEAEAWRSLALE